MLLRSAPAFFMFCLALSGCSLPPAVAPATPLPAEYVPTAVFETLQASQPSGKPVEQPAAQATPAVQELPASTPESPTGQVSPTPEMPTPTGEITLAATPAPLPTATPPPDHPIADIQIFKPGDRSRVVSPIPISAYLRPGGKGRVSLELFGEDGRLLVREIKAFDTPPNARVNLLADLEFGISAAAEFGRLVISTLDEFGRPSALNSVDIILLSLGEEDINPSSAEFQAISIEQPAPKSLIQGGTVLVSGRARTDPDQPLFLELIDEAGKTIGQRQARLADVDANGYGSFAAEVPYSAAGFTPVRLVVYEKGGSASPIRHLTSVEFNLSP